MDCLHILSLADECDFPAVAVRAISDEADTRVPIDFNRVIKNNGRIGWLPALYEIAKAPQRMPELIRFGIESSRAARRLTAFLEQYVELLADRQGRSFSQVMTAETK